MTISMHKKVIAHYGEIAQISKCQEELKELSDELSNCEKMSGTGTREELLGEIADVINCIEQQIIIHGFTFMELDNMQKYKMKRTIERIGEGM